MYFEKCFNQQTGVTDESLDQTELNSHDPLISFDISRRSFQWRLNALYYWHNDTWGQLMALFVEGGKIFVVFGFLLSRALGFTAYRLRIIWFLWVFGIWWSYTLVAGGPYFPPPSRLWSKSSDTRITRFCTLPRIQWSKLRKNYTVR